MLFGCIKCKKVLSLVRIFANGSVFFDRNVNILGDIYYE